MLIDVSMTIKPGAVFRVGAPAVEISRQEFVHPNAGRFQTTMLSLAAHTATHIDLVFRDKRIGMERMVGSGKLLDATGAADSTIRIANIENQPQIDSGEFVFFHTGWSAFAGTEKYHAHPELAEDVVEWLVSKKVNMVGIDAPGLGRDRKHRDYDRLLAQNDIFVIENLTNLSAITTPGFRVFCFPLKLEDVDAIPARVVVEIDSPS